MSTTARSIVVVAVALILGLLLLEGCQAQVNCGRGNERNRDCLDVFTSAPNDLPKCYCTKLCEDHLDDLVHTCGSGELHDDACGACLVCARALGQRCGGRYNYLGMCAGGLACRIEIPANIRADRFKRKEHELSAEGTCVVQRSKDCPSSTNRINNAACRPGKRGIIAEALYCPAGLPSPSQSVSLPTLRKILKELGIIA